MNIHIVPVVGDTVLTCSDPRQPIGATAIHQSGAIWTGAAAPVAPSASGSMPSSAGGNVVPSFSVKDATSHFDARPTGGMVAPTPPWVDDVTTRHFNRAPDSTKLFCNIHDKVQVSKSQFRES